MHAMFTQEPLFTDKQWEELIVNPIEGAGIDGRILKTFALFPNLLLTTRSAFSQEQIDYEKLFTIHAKLESLYTIHTLDRQEVVARFEELDTREPDIMRLPTAMLILHSHYARQVAITVALEIMFCVLLSTICSVPPPSDSLTHEHHFVRRPDLEARSSLLDPYIFLRQAEASSEYLSDLAHKVTQHRPLGTIYMTWVMRLAYIVAPSEAAKARVAEQLLDFAQDMAGPFVELNLEEVDELGDYLTLRDLRGWWPGTGHLHHTTLRGGQGRR